jgi:membrane-associated phospholipid phosphatase
MASRYHKQAWHLPVRGSDVPGGGGRGFRIRAKPLGSCSGQPVASGPPGRRADCLLSMISPASWWWPNRPPRVPAARTAGLLAGLGVVLFGTSALLVKAGTTSGDARLFRILNQVPRAVASVLTPLSHLFLPAGIIAIVVLTVVYAVARNRSVLPVAAAAVAAGAAWVLAHVAKAVADRPRPYEVMSDAVLRQQPPHGTSFPSSHTAVTVAVVIALVPFLVRPLAAVAIGYAVLVGWSRVYLGVHYPLDVLAGAGIGIAVGGVDQLALRTLLGRAGRAANGHHAAADGRDLHTGPEPHGEP